MKNWRTTLIGCCIAIIIAVQPMITEQAVNWKAVGMAALIALFSFVSKDAVVTGGSVAQTQEAERRAEK